MEYNFRIGRLFSLFYCYSSCVNTSARRERVAAKASAPAARSRPFGGCRCRPPRSAPPPFLFSHSDPKYGSAKTKNMKHQPEPAQATLACSERPAGKRYRATPKTDNRLPPNTLGGKKKGLKRARKTYVSNKETKHYGYHIHKAWPCPRYGARTRLRFRGAV